MEPLKIWKEEEAVISKEKTIRRFTFKNLFITTLEAFDLDKGFIHTIWGLTVRPAQTILKYIDTERFIIVNPFRYFVFVAGILIFVTVKTDFWQQEFYAGFNYGSQADSNAVIDPEILEITEFLLKDVFFKYLSVWFALSLIFISLLSMLSFRASGFTYMEHVVTNTYIFNQQCLYQLISIPFVFIFPKFIYFFMLLLVAYSAWCYKELFNNNWLKTIIKTVLIQVIGSTIFMGIVVIIITMSVTAILISKKDKIEDIHAYELREIWQTDTLMTTCESVLYHEQSNQLYVSNINGTSRDKNGLGFISILTAEGAIKRLKWAVGMNAPKGMGIIDSLLYVTDIDEIVIINLRSGAIVNKIKPDTASFLNDISTYNQAVYISDMDLGLVYQLKDEKKLTLFADSLPSVNGLYAKKDGLYVLDADGVKLLSYEDGSTQLINTTLTRGDGLEHINDSLFIGSRWQGEVYLIDGTQSKLLLDTKELKLQTADIGYNGSKRIVYVPTFYGNKVVAYQLVKKVE